MYENRHVDVTVKMKHTFVCLHHSQGIYELIDKFLKISDRDDDDEDDYEGGDSDDNYDLNDDDRYLRW